MGRFLFSSSIIFEYVLRRFHIIIALDVHLDFPAFFKYVGFTVMSMTSCPCCIRGRQFAATFVSIYFRVVLLVFIYIFIRQLYLFCILV